MLQVEVATVLLHTAVVTVAGDVLGGTGGGGVVISVGAEGLVAVETAILGTVVFGTIVVETSVRERLFWYGCHGDRWL